MIGVTNAPSKSAARLPGILLIALLFAASAFADRLPVKLYTSSDGLGSSFIDWIFRDSRGFMWFCTRDGLSRFDGTRFVNYQIGERNAPPGVETIQETSDGTYWVSTTGGTYRFRPENLSLPEAATPAIRADFVSSGRGVVYEDSKKNIWFLTLGIFRWEQIGSEIVETRLEPGLPPKPNVNFVAFQAAETRDGSIWFDTSWGLIRRLADGRTVFYNDDDFVVDGSGAVSMIVDRDDRIWLTRRNKVLIIDPDEAGSLQAAPLTVRSLAATEKVETVAGDRFRLEPRPGTVREFENPEIVRRTNSVRVFKTSDLNIWITAEDNLLELAEGGIRVHRSSEGLPGAMSRLGEDSAGNLWIAGPAGLARMDRRGLTSFGVNEGAKSVRFYAITEDADGTVYFANSDNYIVKYDGRRLIPAAPDVGPNPLHAWTSRFVRRDSRGDWWFLTNQAVFRFSGVRRFEDLDGMKPSRVYRVDQGTATRVMFQIFEDSKGTIWLSTRALANRIHGLFTLRQKADGTDDFVEVPGWEPNRSASAFAEDRSGNLWISLYEGGLARYDGKSFRFFGTEHGLPGGMISDVLVDEKGRLWIGSTVGGALRVNDPAAENPRFEAITTEKGLASNNVRTIALDRFGRIYFGTARGIDRLNPETGNVKHFSVTDGLASDFVVDSHLDRAGNLWFATNNGVSRLIPRPEETVVPPVPLIGRLRIAGIEQPVPQLGSVAIDRGDLTHIENNIEIEFLALNFRPGENLRFQYKLEGADTGWSAPREATGVTFANLSPATYRFLVRAVSADGGVAGPPAVVTFRILRPVWARWWFVALVVLAGLLIVGGSLRYRFARLREVNTALEEARLAEARLRRSREDRIAELEQVRSRIATDLHDDIGASLTQIAILSEVAQAQSKNGGSEPLRAISKVSNELVGTMSDIVWSINPAKDHFSDLTQRMRRFASDLLSARNIVLHFHASHSDDALTVNSNIRREVFLIFKEAVNNIVKHAGATSVEVSVAVENDELVVSIADDGCGIGPDGPAGAGDDGNGIPSMGKRARGMNGRFAITSQGRGTRIDFAIPIEAAAQSGGEARVSGS